MSIEKDYIQIVRQCHQCHIHGNLNHLPPTVLNSLSSPWPFAAWGIDIIGEIRMNASNGHKYIVHSSGDRLLLKMNRSRILQNFES